MNSFISVGCSEKIFTEDGFRNWKKATGTTGRLEKHVKSRAHQLSREKAIFRKSSMPINVQLSNAEAARMSKIEAEKEENRKIVEVIFDVVRHISLQNEAFRGHDEKSASANQGKFLEEIKFLAKYHAPPKEMARQSPWKCFVAWTRHSK